MPRRSHLAMRRVANSFAALQLPRSLCRSALRLFMRGVPEVRSRPSGMLPFTPATTASPGSLQEDGVVLPPWPIDTIEFNTRMPNGGHDVRLAQMAESQSVDTHRSSSHLGEADEGVSGLQMQPVPLTPQEQQALEKAQQSEEGRRALQEGGWVCGHCLTPMPHRSRSVCNKCHVLRHDAVDTVNAWRANPMNWLCGLCHEFNFDRDRECRCCHQSRAVGQEIRPILHERVADEVKHSPVGSVVNTRNRVIRWRCAGCTEINSLKASTCRQCGQERFKLTLTCGSCDTPNEVDNGDMYGKDLPSAIHVTQTFGSHNCYPRLAPKQVCRQCAAPLHGAVVSHLTRCPWWCSCGTINPSGWPSCMRCRLLKSILDPNTLQKVVRAWDVQGCTNWLCEVCDNINTSSHYIVRATTNTAETGGGLRKFSFTVHGDALCRQCGAPWHHQVVGGGDAWRCACHKVNTRQDKTCATCGLPALDNVHVDVLSMWSRGDWYCLNCRRHNYRDRLRCECGVSRSAL